MKNKILDIYEDTFGGYLNWITLVVKEFTIIGVLSAYLNFKDVRTNNIKENEK